MKRFAPLVAVYGAFLIQSTVVSAGEPTVDFAADVLPVLSDKCFACHGPDASGDTELRLDDVKHATVDLGGYRAVNADKPEESELLVRIESSDNPMPPADAEKQLTDYEKKLLRQWIMEGGRFAKHWAFERPQKVASVDGVSVTADNVIDTFIRSKLKSKGVDLSPEADRATLARRASLTLTGLPPEPAELAEYLADTSDDSYERYVDRLMASPQYGEHQARFWLDAVRYGDTHGLHLDNRRGIYPYRDWVVRAFNKNLPLDDFITWQLAGDLLPDSTLEQRVATGFVRMNPTTSEGGVIPAEFQAKNNFDRVETLGTVLLGMTLTCARCHTHKYDPITQTEYYQLIAFFNSTAESPLDGNAYEYGPVERVPADPRSWDEWEAVKRLGAFVVQSAVEEQGDKVVLPENWSAMKLSEQLGVVADDGGAWANSAWSSEAKTLGERLKGLEESFTTTLVTTELPSPRETRLLRRGEYDMPTGDPLHPGVPQIMGALPEGVTPNRMGLAKWLTDAEHPLVTRVIVNRFWQNMFGRGLVRTPEDFGVQGSQPTHPKLLDWLAVDLRESGWDMKRLLRMMVTSETFKQSSARRADLEDPENLLWGRGPRYRLDAEVLRDTGLWASGLLDPTMGGEGVKPYQPDGMWFAMAHPASNTKQYVRDQGDKLYRRSIYVYWKRTSPHPMMTLFDAPDRESSCVRRSRTSTPLQSLAMLNETQRVEMGRKLAERLLREGESDAQRLEKLFMMLASRLPRDRELEACTRLLTVMRERYAGAEEDAKAMLAVGDASRDESVNAAELAAWTQVCMTVLASDSAILLY